MRVSSILIACLVAAAIYMVILERDTLRSLAGADEASDTRTDSAVPAPAQKGDDAVAVVVMRSQRQDVDSTLTLSGQTDAVRRVEVRAETGGTVISEPLRKGSEIATGEVLCRLDPGTRNAELAEAEARLKEARVNYNAAERLKERGFSSETELTAQRAALETAQAAVERAQTELDRLTIEAPFAGVLDEDTAELGSLLQSGSLCSTVIALDPIRLVAFVPESEVGRIRRDAKATARLVTGQQVSGKVSFVAQTADPATRTFRVEVDVPNTDRAIRSGVSATVNIARDVGSGHLLPQSALVLDDDGRLGVRLNDNGTVAFAAVEMIRDTPDGVWVSGLGKSAEVIVRGQNFVSQGRAIRVTYRGEGA